MSNLFESLRSGANTLQVFQRALDVVQNNVTNAQTPGFAKQNLVLKSQPFDIAGGLAGGVSGKSLSSARDEYAEDEVRRQTQSLGYFESQAQAGAAISQLFNVSGTSGIPGALTALFQSFSAWSVDPGASDARQNVLSAASGLSDRVRAVSSGLEAARQSAVSQVGTTVDQINNLAATIHKYNLDRLTQGNSDPGRDANVHAALEQLSELADTTTLIQGDGTVTVLFNGGAPLILGTEQYPVSASVDASGEPAVLDWQHNDITGQITSGKLGGLLENARATIPGIQASMDQFARAFADTVNGILTSGSVSPGSDSPPAALFAFDPARPAATLVVPSATTPELLAAVDAGGIANGNPLKLASLAGSTEFGALNGATFVDAYSAIAAQTGRVSASAADSLATQRQVVAQTRAMRDQTSAVSLDEQAVTLMEFQKNYQAAAKLVTTLNDMLDDVINLIR